MAESSQSFMFCLGRFGKRKEEEEQARGNTTERLLSFPADKAHREQDDLARPSTEKGLVPLRPPLFRHSGRQLARKASRFFI